MALGFALVVPAELLNKKLLEFAIINQNHFDMKSQDVEIQSTHEHILYIVAVVDSTLLAVERTVHHTAVVEVDFGTCSEDSAAQA